MEKWGGGEDEEISIFVRGSLSVLKEDLVRQSHRIQPYVHGQNVVTESRFDLKKPLNVTKHT